MSPLFSQFILPLALLAGLESLPLQGVGEKQQETIFSKPEQSATPVNHRVVAGELLAEGFEPPDRGKPDGTQGSGTRCLESGEVWLILS
jgi:hypothetical protein